MYKYKSFFKIYDHHMLKIHSLEELSLIAQYHGKNFSKSNARDEKKLSVCHNLKFPNPYISVLTDDVNL